MKTAQLCPLIINFERDIHPSQMVAHEVKYKKPNGQIGTKIVKRRLVVDPMTGAVMRSHTSLDSRHNTTFNNHTARGYYMKANKRSIHIQRVAFWAQLNIHDFLKFCQIL